MVEDLAREGFVIDILWIKSLCGFWRNVFSYFLFSYFSCLPLIMWRCVSLCTRLVLVRSAELRLMPMHAFLPGRRYRAEIFWSHVWDFMQLDAQHGSPNLRSICVCKISLFYSKEKKKRKKKKQFFHFFYVHAWENCYEGILTETRWGSQCNGDNNLPYIVSILKVSPNCSLTVGGGTLQSTDCRHEIRKDNENNCFIPNRKRKPRRDQNQFGVLYCRFLKYRH